MRAIKPGFLQIWKNKRLVSVFYLANLSFGLIIILPLRAIIDDFVGYRLMGADLAGRLDMDFFFEVILHKDSLIDVSLAMVLVVPAAFWLFLLFLSGGAFAILAASEKYSPASFWGNSATYFGRYLRLALWSLPLLAIFMALPFLVTGAVRLLFGKDPYQDISYWGGWLRVVLGFVATLIFGIIFDYSRIHTVRTGEHKMRVSLWHGFRFALGNLKYTFGLAALLFVIGGLILAIYYPIANLLSAPMVLVVTLMFLTQQLYMVVRMVLRLTLYASQLQLHERLSAAPARIAEPPADPFAVEGAVA
ncbi:MAG TPA: hypothetical protein VGA99_08900 [bacterium]